MSPESRDVDKEDWGIFEDQVENAQGQSLKRGKQSKVQGMEMLNNFAFKHENTPWQHLKY